MTKNDIETYKKGYLTVLGTFPLEEIIRASVRLGYESGKDPEGLVFGNESAWYPQIEDTIHKSLEK